LRLRFAQHDVAEELEDQESWVKDDVSASTEMQWIDVDSGSGSAFYFAPDQPDTPQEF